VTPTDETATSNEIVTIRPSDSSKDGVVQAMRLVTAALYKLSQADELLTALPSDSVPQSVEYVQEVLIVSRTMRGVARVLLECLRRTQSEASFVRPIPKAEVGEWLKSQIGIH
jgi:hypothetical protein